MSVLTNPVVQRLIVSVLSPVLGYLGLEATFDDATFAALGAAAMAAHALWATLKLDRRKATP